MKTFLFVLEVKPLEQGTAYEYLPLHCTLMHRFRTSMSAQALLTRTAPIFAHVKPLVLEVGGPALFGPSAGPKNIAVNIIEKTSELEQLHLQLYHLLNGESVEHTEPLFSGEGYTPHGLREGTSHIADTVSLIEIVDSVSAQKYIHARVALT